MRLMQKLFQGFLPLNFPGGSCLISPRVGFFQSSPYTSTQVFLTCLIMSQHFFRSFSGLLILSVNSGENPDKFRARPSRVTIRGIPKETPLRIPGQLSVETLGRTLGLKLSNLQEKSQEENSKKSWLDIL